MGPARTQSAAGPRTRWCVVTFVEPAPAEFGREAWPLHLTWVPPFDAAEDDVVRALTQVLAAWSEDRSALETQTVGEAWFGRRREVRVTELARTGRIDALHRAMLAALADTGVDVRAMRHVRDAFRPHVSAQGERALALGTVVDLSEVALVAMRPDADARRRRVVRRWPLDGAEPSADVR